MELKITNPMLKHILRRILGESSEPKKAPKPISSQELLARFVYSSGHLNAQGIKHQAFMPPPSNLETSVFRKSEMTAGEYKVTRQNLEEERSLKDGVERRIRAAGLITVRNTCSVGSLKIEPEETNYIWHANIIDWPDDKHERKALAQQLVKLCSTERFTG